MNWLRWHHGTTRDPKWRVIAQKADVPIPTVIAIWAALLENASEAENRGSLSGWDAEDVAACFNVTPETVVTVCNAMQQKVLDGDLVRAWEKRNPLRERVDSSTERVRRFRAKETKQKPPETPGNAAKRPDKIREEEIREEKKEKKPAAVDDRRVPFRDFMFAELRGVGIEPVTDKGTWDQYERFLTKTRGKPPFTLELLQEYFRRFVHSPDDFHQRQGQPIRWFVNNISGFMRNGNGNGARGQNSTDSAGKNRTSRGDLSYTPKQ